MKKGKVISKGHIAVGVMVVALCAAVWLNTKYLPTDTKYLGEVSYVDSTSGETVETGAKVENGDYFTTAKKDREKARQDAVETIEDTLEKENLTDEDKKSALAKIEEIGGRMESENNIETLLKAKGFEKTLAVISDGGVSIIVKSEGLTNAQTMQIQDVVTSNTHITLDKIKIIPVA